MHHIIGNNLLFMWGTIKIKHKILINAAFYVIKWFLLLLNITSVTLDKKCTYTLSIARFRAQYDQYFPSFSYFVNLFHEITTKYEKRGKYWTCDN